MARDSSSELIPRPDPTKLTTEAVERATALYRSELMGAQKLLDQQIAALDRLLNRRLDDADRAVTKAEAAADKRFEGLNEFRKALSDQASTFIPRAEYNSAHKAVVDHVAVNGERIAALELSLTSRIDRGEGADSGSAHRVKETRENMVLGVMALTMVISVVAILVSVFMHVH